MDNKQIKQLKEQIAQDVLDKPMSASKILQRLNELEAAVRDEDRWQSIDRAPKDGDFLVFGGKWEGEVTFGEECDFPIKVYRHGDCFCVSDTDYYTAYVENPTHWQPLPEPPKEVK